MAWLERGFLTTRVDFPDGTWIEGEPSIRLWAQQQGVI
jgi:hypothetical protein